MLYVYVTDQCQQDAARINTQADVEALKQKIFLEQSTSGLERHPYPFLKKRIGRTRVVMAEVYDGQDVVLCFLRHVFKKDIGEDYAAFFRTIRVPRADDPELITFLANGRATPIATKEPPSDLELEYLILDREQEIGQLTVLESPIWIGAMRTMKETQGKQGLLTPVLEVLQKILQEISDLQRICDDNSGERQTRCERPHSNSSYNVRVLYRYFPASNTLFLIAPLEGVGGETDQTAVDARKLLNDSADFDETQLLRNAARAYPDFILYDREIWESTQASIDANLALSPEESDVLSHVLDPTRQGGFPLFINGRPGSGKSTILQYLFAEYLHAHLARPAERRLPRPPLYLTYNERLLENARKVVKDIFRCGAEKLALNELVNLNDKLQREEFDRAFAYFREFLLLLLGGEGFDQSKYVDFHRFRALYSGNLSQGPDSKLRQLAPEVAWHTVRTYIKGKNAGRADFFDPESYAELPRDEITVTPKTFELVWDKVWNGWYRILCEQDGYWDDQDLARRVLDQELVLPEYPAIFCDEAQDFTTVELELIFRLSCFATKRIDPYYLKRVPYAFAGDPFQTLNPTGFRWDAIKANFHDNIVRQLDPDRRGTIGFTFKELAFNYRSTASIVRFCNLMQLKRAALFDVPDVAPQKAWAIDKGAWPAYFELDLGTQGRLRDQTELVIIIPCQEGEEKAFIESDEYLRTIALDTKGEIARSVLSPMRAKGLEFGRVVLYKFGSQAVTDGHVEVMQRITAEGNLHLEREQTLGLEYFFNGAYVGASRAQRRLLVVDTVEGLAQFWNFATDAGAIGGLLTERRRSVWAEDDLHHMMRGDSSTWSEDRDNPKGLADRFFEQGKLEQSTYLLQLARNQYTALDDAERRERCTAMIHDIEGEYREAAASYETLGELAEAIRCYWEAKDYNKISETSARDAGRFNMSPVVVAARFVSGKRVVERATQFFTELSQINVERRRVQFKWSHWAEVIQMAAAVLSGDPKQTSPTSIESATDVWRPLSRMQSEEGLILEKTQELALLAFNAADPVAALDVWKEVKRRTNEREHGFIIRARAMTTPYPQRLRWYGQLEDYHAVVAEYKAHSSTDLEDEYREVVIKALVDQKDFPSAIELLRNGGSWDAVRRLLLQLSNSKADKDSARALLGTYLRKGLERGEFRQIIEDVKPGKTSITALAALLSDEQCLLATEASLIKLLARSQALVDERSDDNFVSGTILTTATKRANKLKDLVSPEEVGAALERAGRMDKALEFYESVFRDKRWGSDRGTVDNAKERWLKCKHHQAELDRKNEQRKNLRLAEAKRMSAEWGMHIPAEEYPVLNALTPGEIDGLLGAVSGRIEAKETASLPVATPGHEPSESQSDSRSTTLESRQAVSSLQPVVSKPEEVVTLGESGSPVMIPNGFSWPLPTRPAGGRVDISCNCGGIHVKAKLLPRQRRLELTDETSDDLAMIRVGDGVVESPDLQVTAVDETTWRIEPWSLTVALVEGSPDTKLVDLSDSEGRRILCLAV